MANNGTTSNYSYAIGAGGDTFTLDSHGRSGVVVSVP